MKIRYSVEMTKKIKISSNLFVIKKNISAYGISISFPILLKLLRLRKRKKLKKNQSSTFRK